MLQSQDSNGIRMEMFSMRGIEVLTTEQWQDQIKDLYTNNDNLLREQKKVDIKNIKNCKIIKTC